MLLPVEATGVQQQTIPQGVQVRAFAIEADLGVIAAAVITVAGMQGLVDVADHMHHELQ